MNCINYHFTKQCQLTIDTDQNNEEKVSKLFGISLEVSVDGLRIHLVITLSFRANIIKCMIA